MADNIKPATFNIRLSYLKAFFDWCISEGILHQNPLSQFKKRKADGRVVNLDLETLKSLISLPNVSTFAGLRDYALILINLDTGIRAKEAFSLLVDDINFRALEVYVRSDIAKTKVARTLPISPVTGTAIKNMIQSRHPSWKDSVPVFCTAEGTMFNNGTWGDRMKMYSKMFRGQY